MPRDLVYTVRGGEVRLWYKGRPVLRHEARRPCLLWGQGQATYTARHGSYTITDEATLNAGREWEVSGGSDGEAWVLLSFRGGGRLRATESQGRLVLAFEGFPPETNRLVLNLEAEDHEAIYGCGEQYSYFNLRGRAFPLWTEEQGVGRGPNLITLAANLAMGAGGTRFSTYFPLPAFVSSEAWSCRIATHAYVHLDFRSRRRHRLEVWDPAASFTLDVQPSLEVLVGRLSEAEGRQPPCPAWAQSGLILGAQGGSQAVREKVAILRKAGAPLAGLWAQDWCGRRVTSFGSQLMWNWEADRTLYPDLGDLIAELGDQGIRFLGYLNPFLALEGRLYREASARGYCVKDRSGRDYLATVTTFPAAMVDLTNPEAFAWMKGVITEGLLGAGLAGWMADFGEYLPVDAVLASGESGEVAHNAYAVLWARANHEAVAEAGRLGEVFYFCRSGHRGSAAHVPSFWAGDQLVNWNRDDGLPSVLPAALSLGLSGVGHSHADLGGYTTVAWLARSRDLLLRWAEAAAFSPVMRSHEGNRPARNHQPWSSPETASAIASLARLHRHLGPCLEAAARDHQARGLPLMRPLVLHYPGEAAARGLASEFLLGRDLLVAPVLSRGARGRRVYLPEDEWIEAWTGQPASPGWRRVAAPLGRPPVFYRRASALAALYAGIPEGR